MTRRDREKPKRRPASRSEHVNQLKARALTQLADQAAQANYQHQTVALLTEAVRREPNNSDLLLKLAVAHGRRRNYEKAESLLQRLQKLASRKPSIYRQVAGAYAAIDRPEQAIQCYRRALELYRDKSATIPTLLDLAGLYERRNQLEEARAAVGEALRHNPTDTDALLQQAVLDRRLGEISRSESRLHALATAEASEWHIRSQAWYELAQLLDSKQEYDEAFAAFQAAKRLLKPHAGPHLRESQTMCSKSNEMAAMLERGYYEQWRDQSQQDTPYRFAVLTSHPRSGTTLVEQVLDSHDEVITADEFDVITQWIYLPIVRRFPFTDSVLSILDRVPPAVRQQARAMYWQQTEAILAGPIGTRLLIDKNPAMTMLLPVVNWAFPEAKMLIALRDPRDVVLSCFMQKLRLNPISVNWLSLGEAAEYYAQTMALWLAVRKHTPGRWIEFRYERVVADLPAEARRILDFLEVPWDEKVLRFYEHAREKMIRSPTYKDVTQPIYQRSVGRWQHYAHHFEPIIEKLEPYVKEFGYEPG